jgi:hypothetical protein
MRCERLHATIPVSACLSRQADLLITTNGDKIEDDLRLLVRNVGG